MFSRAPVVVSLAIARTAQTSADEPATPQKHCQKHVCSWRLTRIAFEMDVKRA